ncbi:hypothetical protein BaRGS_00040302, partial [Batillaria attramentaria]
TRREEEVEWIGLLRLTARKKQNGKDYSDSPRGRSRMNRIHQTQREEEVERTGFIGLTAGKK